ncbi:ribonuclease H-like domain-containing protein [Amylocystis lapponica]|nr:ribonuclease H-like domain-containing protein [Amylocystis lapponica]
MAQSSTPAELSPAGFNEYNTALQGAALKATKHAAAIPSDIAFHRSVDRRVAREADAAAARVLALANRLLTLVSTADVTESARRKGKARLEGPDDVVDSFHALVVDSMDQLLERADICLDEYLGRSKPPAIAVNPVQPSTSKTKKPNVPQGRLDPALQHASHLPKPQLLFKRKPDNSRDSIWHPILRHKYNAQVPLGYNLHNDSGDEDDTSTSSHPYRYEIKHLDYPARVFAPAPPEPPRSFADTPFEWVDTPAMFAAMLDALRGAREIAVDLEHHSFRTFAGFVCLVQLSTRAGDWVVDALALRDELEALNEVFTDPQIIKVFHGAESDIVWLQQDFNVYVVNLFDTYHASKVLQFPRHGLAALLDMYCDYTADKRYQLADWRIRPLPAEMLAYARSDTHFLLYIYDHLRNALLDRSGAAAIHTVLARSADTALRVFAREPYDAARGSGPSGWDTLARKWNKGALAAAAAGAGAVFRAVHAWRDRVAREEDESTRYVLPNHHLFALAERPPADVAALLAALHPVPPVVRRRAKELLDAVRAAAGAVLPVRAPAPEARVEEAAPVEVEVEAAVGGAASTVLWSHVSRPAAAALSSALFGPYVVVEASGARAVAYAAPRSALFGTRAGVVSANVNKVRFQEVLARIHGALVIAPSVPGVPVRAEAAEDESAAAEEGPAGAIETEMAFVPAAQRQEARREPVEDTIVVVGQAQAKKRKRSSAKAAKAAAGEEAEGGVEEFDYGAVSNILDEGSEPETGDQGRKKKKRGKGASGYQYGDFGAAPKAHSQPKSGNVSRTMRK